MLGQRGRNVKALSLPPQPHELEHPDSATRIVDRCSVPSEWPALTSALLSEPEVQCEGSTPVGQPHSSLPSIACTVTGDGFVGAVATLQGAGLDGDLCAPFLSVLPVTGVAISTLGDPLGSETVCASDAAVAHLEEIQLDLGEGPCWEAMLTGVPVLQPDVQTATPQGWPMALLALREAGLGAVFAFPMRVGTLNVGAVDLYDETANTLPASALRDATALVHVVARHVLHRALVQAGRSSEEPRGSGGRYSRREVYQASGMLAAQTGTNAADALLLLRAYAHSAGRPVRDLSADIIARKIDFTDRADFGS